MPVHRNLLSTNRSSRIVNILQKARALYGLGKIKMTVRIVLLCKSVAILAYVHTYCWFTDQSHLIDLWL
jgi:methylaspartate ammonia-lyase